LYDKFGGRFRIIPSTNVHLSLNSSSPPTYTFNSLVFHSHVFHPCYLVSDWTTEIVNL